MLENLGDRFERDTRRGLDVVGHDPAADSSAVQLDPHQVAQVDACVQIVGDRVVEPSC